MNLGDARVLLQAVTEQLETKAALLDLDFLPRISGCGAKFVQYECHLLIPSIVKLVV